MTSERRTRRARLPRGAASPRRSSGFSGEGPSSALRAAKAEPPPSPALRVLPTVLLVVALAIGVAGVIAVARYTGRAPTVIVRELLDHPDRYQGQMVAVAGAVKDLRVRSSHRRYVYTEFTLVDGASGLSVFSRGVVGVAEGDRVVVRGVFWKLRRVRQWTFRTQIDATGCVVEAR